MSNSKPVKRLNVNLPAATYDELQAFSKRSGRTMTEIVRMGVGLAQIAVGQDSQQNSLAVVDADGKLVKQILVL